MSHVCGRASSDKERIINVSKQIKTLDKNCCSLNKFTTDCICSNHYSKTDGHHRMKRLKSRKERSQMRGGVKEASKSKSHHHHCRHQSSKDIVCFRNCCRSSCQCPSRRDALFPNVAPAATQEPSIITDSRLIGHHGLFNHEVKSIDIERFLNKQRKMENNEQEVQENNNATSHPSSTSRIPSPLSSNDLLGADNEEVRPSGKKADPTMKEHDDCQEKEREVSQGSDVTPGQRPQQQPESQLTPTADREHVKTLKKKVKGHVISTLEHTPKNQTSPGHQTQAHGSSPLQLSSSHTAGGFDIQHTGQEPDYVSQSISAVAAGLCGSLQFPLQRRRNLVSESRKVLLRALQEKHGPKLQENLLEVQRGLNFGTYPAKEVQDEEPTTIDEELLSTDGYTAAFQAHTSQPCFDTLKTASFIMKGSGHFNWKSSPQPHQNLKQTAEWLRSPVETSASFLDDIVRPTRPPLFCMDFEPPGISDHLFTSSPASCWGEKASASHHWGDTFYRPKSKGAVMFGSFENGFMNHSRALTERSSGSQYSDTQPFFPYQAQLPDRHTAEPVLFERHSFAPSFSAQVAHPQPSNHFQPFSQVSHPSSYPPRRSHHTDMIHYPPSHMLERDPAPPRSFCLSPEHWSFPPMRLY